MYWIHCNTNGLSFQWKLFTATEKESTFAVESRWIGEWNSTTFYNNMGSSLCFFCSLQNFSGMVVLSSGADWVSCTIELFSQRRKSENYFAWQALHVIILLKIGSGNFQKFIHFGCLLLDIQCTHAFCMFSKCSRAGIGSFCNILSDESASTRCSAHTFLVKWQTMSHNIVNNGNNNFLFIFTCALVFFLG